MNYEKIKKLEKKILKELFSGIQELLTDNLSIRITMGKKSNESFDCKLYQSDIGVIKNPWSESEDGVGMEIDKLKSKNINLSSKTKLPPEGAHIKKEILENRSLILNIMSEYDDVLISPTTINCEKVAAFEADKLKKKILKR